MAEISVGKEIAKDASKEIAKSLVNIYNNYNKNRDKMKEEIDNFIKRTKAIKAMEVHTKTYEYTVEKPDLAYFKEGHELLNKIRTLLGLEEVDYAIGILDEINGKAYQVNVEENEFSNLMRKRGNKSGLFRTMSSINQFLDEHENKNDITDKFLSFIKILEKKTDKNKDNLNYGYAFEAFGHFEYKDGGFKATRHQTYYNYYKASRKNTEAWTTGGDVNNTQYKLIRIYRDEKGRKQISSASVTSSYTIITELTFLKQLLNSEPVNPEEISLVLAKHFTQLDIPNELDEGLNKIIKDAFKNF